MLLGWHVGTHIRDREPTINFALALIIDEHACSEAQAIDALCRLSQERHVKVTELSRRIVGRTMPVPATQAQPLSRGLPRS
jgi:hypothetical protein